MIKVAGAKAGPLGRRIVDRGNDLDETTVFLPTSMLQPPPNSPDVPICKSWNASASGRRNGIEVAQHAANRVFQQILVLDRFHIILLDGIEYAGEGATHPEGARLLSAVVSFSAQTAYRRQ